MRDIQIFWFLPIKFLAIPVSLYQSTSVNFTLDSKGKVQMYFNILIIAST